MNYIKAIRIHGYKKFEKFEVKFQPGLNILIGENSAGKSTILEAIEIVLNQATFKYDYSQLESLLNKTMVETFLTSQKHLADELPSIEIEVFFNFETNPKFAPFFGEQFSEFNSKKPTSFFGIKFNFEFDKDFLDEFEKIDFSDKSQRVIPLEYYHSSWRTFRGDPYVSRMNPLHSLLIDNSRYMYDLYGSYAKRIFNLQVEKNQQRQASYAFKQSMISALNDNEDKISLSRAHQRFTINQRKAQLADLIDISEDDIPLQNMGKGKESLVKTELSLDSKASLVMIEEPENHLSYSNTRKMIAQINSQSDNAQQVIVTTHESMVLNRLNLDHAIWIRDSKGESLESLSDADAEFFKRNDDFDILKFILADKVILVEGASEYITVPAITKKVLGKDLDELGISVLSLHGIHYKDFFDLAERLNKRVLILTDNDGSKNEHIDEQNAETADNIYIQTPSDPDIFTFEVALDQVNHKLTEEYRAAYHPKSKSTSYKKEYTNLDKALACALANKTEFAIYIAEQFEKNDSGVLSPAYIEEGLKWLQRLN